MNPSSHAPVNLHRSVAGLVVGNIVAILVSSFVCVLVWQAAFPDFYAQLRKHLNEVKQVREDGKKKQSEEKDKQEADSDKKSTEEDENAEPQVAPLPEFNLAILVVTLMIDATFAAAAGLLCVLIAGFAPFNHALLMALFLLVWKFQQLIGFVNNHLPPTLVLAEVICLPIACFGGASLWKKDHSEVDGDETPGTDNANPRDINPGDFEDV